jgi:DNA-binding beta-propeller fold protein YncE
VQKNKDCTGTTAEKTACRKMHAAQRKSCRNLVELCKQQNPRTRGACLRSRTTTSTLVTVTSTTIPTPSSCGIFLSTWGSSGSGSGQFNQPTDVATDGSGNVYVADAGNDRIQKFDARGTFLSTWGSHGSANGQFNQPTGVATDGSGNFYVADFTNNRVQKFACR